MRKSTRIIIVCVLAVIVVGAFLFREIRSMKTRLDVVKELKNNPLPQVKMTPFLMKDGDLIFHKSLSSQSEAIALATHSEYTHCGIVYKIENNYFIYEAIEPVRMTPLIEWMGRGKGGAFVVKRLKDAEQVLTAEKLQRLKEVGDRFKGRHYDIHFEWTDEKMYCSELIWKVYKEATGLEIGKRQKLRDFDLRSDLVKQKMKERYGNKIPLDEFVISPSSIFNSELLINVQ